MNAVETSMLLVKPDGVEKGLIGNIRDMILAEGLSIKREVERILTPGTVEKLYRNVCDVPQRDYFPELVRFMSSKLSYAFVVQGEDAVAKVRAIIGKRNPASGIRERWAESIIKNVAHGPHAPEEARREVELVLDNESIRKVFLIGGMSECGKSTFGRYLDSRGIARLKIVFFLKRVMVREGANGDFYEWNNRNVAERPEWVRQEFTEEFLAWANENGVTLCCLESLYGPDLGVYMRNHLEDGRAVVVYVGIPLEVRLQRQIIRQNLGSLKEAEEYLLPRDEIKKAWRVPEIEQAADVVVDNSGSLADLHRLAEEMITQHLPE